MFSFATIDTVICKVYFGLIFFRVSTVSFQGPSRGKFPAEHDGISFDPVKGRKIGENRAFPNCDVTKDKFQVPVGRFLRIYVKLLHAYFFIHTFKQITVF